VRPSEFYARIAELSEHGTPFTVATITDVKGSAPRGLGARMLVYADGSIEETVGGGTLEREVIAESLACLVSGDTCSRTYQLRAEGEHALGALCGGEVTVLFEPHGAGRVLLIVGAGHVGQKLCPLAAMLDHRVVVLDSRADTVTRERFPDAAELICDDPGRAAAVCDIGGRTSVVIVTHSAEHDERALRAVIDAPAAYVGMMGSRNKVGTIFDRLRRDGAPEGALARVRAPIGLDIGAETPAELALCIMAEIVAAEYGKLDGTPAAASRLEPAAEGEA
jgi:xanthine dehydrogenase accessory factor